MVCSARSLNLPASKLARSLAGLEAIEDYIPQKVDRGVGSVASGVNGDEYAGVELRCQTDDGIPTGIAAGVSEYRALCPVLVRVIAPSRARRILRDWQLFLNIYAQAH